MQNRLHKNLIHKDIVPVVCGSFPKMFRKTFVLLNCVCVLADLVAAVHAEEDEEFYDTKYDHLDINEILANDRLRNQYFTCLMETKPCITDSAKFLKDNFPEALVTKCRKCTERQKYMFERVVDYYTKNEPDNWNIVLKTSIDRIQNKNKHRR